MPLYHDFKQDYEIRKTYKETTCGGPLEAADVSKYVSELRAVLEAAPMYGTPPDPSEVIDRVYLGTVANAENVRLLRRLGITHILNCAGLPVIRYERETRYQPEHGIEGYEEIPAEDTTGYDISRHFLRAHRFIDHARMRGRVLIYCPEVSRSGAVAMSYLIRKGVSLMEAAELMKRKRKVALLNVGFMRQLVVFARDRGLLERGQPHLQGRAVQARRATNADLHLLKFM